MYLGLCLPEVCSIADMNLFKPTLVMVINQVIAEVFQGVKGFDLDK
jgi:hypothetical protein